MTIAETLAFAKKLGVDILDAELLLADILELQQAYVIAHPEFALTEAQDTKIRTLLQRMAKMEPLAYLTKSKEFFGLPLYVDNHVLVPRPESEEAVSWFLDKAKIQTFHSMLDVGTGSGALACALAKHLPHCEVVAVDTKESILDVARKNAKDLGLQNITFIKSNLLESIEPEQQFDGIIANLPYLNPNWQRDPSTQHEPKEALYTDNNGLGLYQILLSQLPKHLHERAAGIFEADPRNAEELLNLTQEALKGFHCELKEDLASLPRFVTFEK